MCKALIVDNFDSFTYNLYQYMGEVCGEEPDVVLNNVRLSDMDIDNYDCIIVSPGPGHPAVPADVGISVEIIRRSRVPLLGVCLGHQCMAQMYGMEVVHAPEPVHGRLSVVQHDNKGVFKGLPQALSVVRYHSLVVKQIRLPFVVTAWGEGAMIHGIRHVDRPLHGIQFHPESICTQAGKELLSNFRDIAVAYRAGETVQLC